jgi:hypothetical protein
MFKLLYQVVQYMAFTVAEYARSGRVLIEAAAAIGCALIFFRPNDAAPSTPEYFFSIAGTFSLLVCMYTASAIFALGDRQQTYVLMAHGLSRNAFLLGLFATIVCVISASYGIFCLTVAVINPIAALDVRGWLLGSIPLLLNVALLAALLTLLAPMVLQGSWRLITLALVALAFSGSLISGPTMAALPGGVAMVLDVSRTILGAPLLPAFTGFALAISRDYSGISMFVPLAQAALVVVILYLAVVMFRRRELVFQG